VANRLAATNSPEAQPARDVLLRFTLSSDGSPSHVERTSLRSYLEVTEPFQSFSRTASKENGVDAEGLAFWKGSLFVGFRGPVIRGNLTPILKCSFGQPIQNPELFFVNLGGRGVRDLAALKKHLLILAGPMGDGPGHFQLYLWDGRDGVPGGGAPTSPADPGIILIGDVPIPTDAAGRPESGAKAEGLAVFEKASGEHHWEVLIVFDGLKNGHAMKYRIEKPQ